MANINLLPQEMGSSPLADKLAKKLKSYLINEVIILILVVVAGLVIYFYYTNQIDQSTTRVSELKGQISSQESSEQKLILIKDRIAKAQVILSEDDTLSKVDQLDLLLDILPAGVDINRADLNESRLEVDLFAENTSSLANILSLVVNNGEYSKVEMISLGYAPQTGFGVTLDLFE